MRGAGVLQRVLAKVASGDGDCWTFGGCRIRGGYGQIRLDGRSVTAHRVAYEHLVGPIATGLELDHLCFNRACVNPAHLEPVTHAENQRRTRPGARGQQRAEFERAKTHCPRQHPYDDANTYVATDGARSCRACRRERYAERTAA